MDPVLAVFLLAIGIPNAVWPYKFAKFEEQVDSIGSKRSWSEVEPADWKVALTRVVGIGIALFALANLFAG
ncbi:hypothetical protein ACOZ35_03020 [Halorubrum xinjiangense]|uniref:hypothetical protein n=1 Tax=Halorubrum xinjiangense TaxID=261291 RepID=UPI003C6EA904